MFPNTENRNGKLKLESGACEGGIASGPVGYFVSREMLEDAKGLTEIPYY